MSSSSIGSVDSSTRRRSILSATAFEPSASAYARSLVAALLEASRHAGQRLTFTPHPRASSPAAELPIRLTVCGREFAELGS
jgi:hypothetical protein